MEAIQLEAAGSSENTLAEQALRLILPHFPLQLAHPQSPERGAAEEFIVRRFQTVYDAHVTHFLSYLLYAHDEHKVQAALGFQPAQADKPLFLEHYLDERIETVLGSMTGADVQRHNVIEIGNLASGKQRATQTLFILIADILQQVGYEWVVFTANHSVQQWLNKLKLTTISICEAEPERLPDQGASWGSYYQDRPVVLASNIQQSFERLQQDRVVEFLRRGYESRIADFVNELKR